MAIRSGSVLTEGNGFIIDRIQSAGPGLSIPSEKIYELGNYETVAEVRDTPELSFDLESLDVSTEIEALLLGLDPTTVAPGQELLLLNAKPLDIISPFKSGLGLFNIVKSIALPYLTLESATYRFGVQANSTQAFTLRGDSIYYVPGTAYYQTFPVAGAGPYAFTNAAIKTVEAGVDLYAYCVWNKRTDGTYQRLFVGDEYTNTSTGFTLTAAGVLAAPDGTLHVVYGSTVVATYPQSVHQTVAVKPAAVRGKDIDVYISDGAATPTMIRWAGLQSAEVTWRLALEATRELGNPHVVSQDYDVPELSGTLTMKPASVGYLFERVAQITGVPVIETINALSSVPLDMEIRISHPTSGVVLKTLKVAQARFVPPASAFAANTRLEVPFTFTSDTGRLAVHRGVPA